MVDIILNKNIFRKLLLIILILLYMFYGCRDYNENDSGVKFVRDSQISDSNFKQLGGGYSFNIKFKNVWLDYDFFKGKLIKIPIFQGENGDVRISQLRKKLKVNDNITIIGALKFYAKKGMLKKTILDCVNFYKESLFKDIDARVPTIIAGEGTSLIIWYDFEYMGYPSSVMIGTLGGDRCKDHYRYIDDICVNEKFGWFHFKILIGDKSPFVDQKDKIQEILDKLEK